MEKITVRADLSQIVDYFIKGYEIPKGSELYSYEFFIDPVRNKTIIDIMIIKKGE